MNEDQKQELISAASDVKKMSYAPYSKFYVGAAVQAESGEIYVGTNVENASFGLTICAERAAIFNAISHGARKISAIAVMTASEKPTSPCGACRQVLREFSDPNALVIMVARDGTVDYKTIGELLPLSFCLPT
jgi:cytidine deaminase